MKREEKYQETEIETVMEERIDIQSSTAIRQLHIKDRESFKNKVGIILYSQEKMKTKKVRLLKEQLTSKSKNPIFPLTCSTIYQSSFSVSCLVLEISAFSLI